ncbi:MAG: anthranilate phosphoribosyltransferase [Acidobacteria bacterium]|nr:anthranilate phosphoribosyltransferase [Acidobacteriota bacterium]
MILDCIEKVFHGQNLTVEQAAAAMEEILSGEATATQSSALLVALAMKGETEQELLGMARVLRGKTYLFSQYGPVEVGLCNSERRLLLPESEEQESRSAGVAPGATFNISTAVAFVAAGAGVRLLQQGHRSANSELESAGVLEALGINTRLPVWKIARGVAEVGLGFVFEPVISQAMEQLSFAYREIPVPTAFQLLLPMLDPGGAPGLVIGVHSARMTETVANVVAQLGVRRAFVFHGSDGLDEITNTGPTTLAEVREGRISVSQIQPGDFGFPVVRLEELAGGDASQCAVVIRSILQGEAGPRRHVVLLNAAPVIVCAGKAKDLAEGVKLAAEAIDSGRALQALERMAAFSQQSEPRP